MVKVSGVKALATTAALNLNSGIFEVIGTARDQSQVRLRPSAPAVVRQDHMPAVGRAK